MVKLAGKHGVWSSIPSIVGVWQSLWDHGTYEHLLGWMAPRYGLHQFTQWKPFPKNAPPTMESHGNSMMHSQPIDSLEWNSVSWSVIFKRFTNWGLVKLGGRCLKLMVETTETLPIFSVIDGSFQPLGSQMGSQLGFVRTPSPCPTLRGVPWASVPTWTAWASETFRWPGSPILWG